MFATYLAEPHIMHLYMS